jgi:hypothetical protein
MLIFTIPKRLISDIVNILMGAGLVERTREINTCRWTPKDDFSLDLKNVEEEEHQLDDWIRRQTAKVNES